MKKIVVVGCGFGGISLVKSLKNSNFEILMIDKNNYHTFQPLLYQVATGGLEPNNIAYPIRRIFRKKKNFKFRMAEVLTVDTKNQSLQTSIGEISYDYLVIGTGSANNFFNFEPIKEDLLPLKSMTNALDIRSKLMQNIEKVITLSDNNLEQEVITVSIIGAGPTGLEIAGALAEMKKKVLPKDFPEFDFRKMHIYLFEAADRVLASMSEEASKASLEYLKELGIEVKLNARVKEYDTHKVILEDGSEFPCNTVIWTAGVKGAPIEGLASESLGKGKRISVNAFNQVTSLDNVFAIGDVAAQIDEKNPKGLPMLAQVAIQHGSHLAKNFNLLEQNIALQAFEYVDRGSMATIGRNKAVVDLPFFKTQGRLAWFIWMFIHLVSLVGHRNKLITLIDWTQNYFSYDRPLGAIIRKYKKKA